MSVPHPVTADTCWTSLDADAKRARAVQVAGELFAREGLDVPMPVLAEALGVGVGSLYRQVGKKDDLVALIVLARAAEIEAVFREAAERPDAGPALREAVMRTVEAGARDWVMREAWELTSEREDVGAARASLIDGFSTLLDRARAAGAADEGARSSDLRLLFAGAREAEALIPGGARRLAELVLTGLGVPE